MRKVDLRANARVLHKATPTAVSPASIYTRASNGWSLVPLLDNAGGCLMSIAVQQVGYRQVVATAA